MSGSTNRIPANRQVSLTRVAITDVDAPNHAAVGTDKTGKIVHVDTSHYVGGTQITPNIGDQWYISTVEGVNRLHSRIPFNDPNETTTTPTAGQHVIGSGQGPIRMQAGPGNVISADAPIQAASYPTAGRPAASSVPAGSHVYDSTLGKPIWSNGTTWTDATGATV